LSCERYLRVKTKWNSRYFLEEFLSKGWSKSNLHRLITKIDNGLPIDRIIGRGYRRPIRTTATVARVEELICSHIMAPSSVLRFH